MEYLEHEYVYETGDQSDSRENTPDDSESDIDQMEWVNWFCRSNGHEFFCQVEESYITDDFNLVGIKNYVASYEQALDLMIDDLLPPDDEVPREDQKLVQNSAEMLYGLIHARYILTNRGLAQMIDKFHRGEFGICPRVSCKGQHVVPVGLSDNPRVSKVLLFCPRCQQVYYPKEPKVANLDGSYFGTTFAHLMFFLHPHLAPIIEVPPPPQPLPSAANSRNIPPEGSSTTKVTQPTNNQLPSSYVPKIYGFQLHSDWQKDYFENQEILNQAKTNLELHNQNIKNSKPARFRLSTAQRNYFDTPLEVDNDSKKIISDFTRPDFPVDHFGTSGFEYNESLQKKNQQNTATGSNPDASEEGSS